MTGTTTPPRRSAAALLLVLAGCASVDAPPPYTPQAVAGWQRVELRVEIGDPWPPRATSSGSGPVPVVAPAGTPGAAVGVGILVGVLLAGLDQAAERQAVEEQARLQPALAGLDLQAMLREAWLRQAPPFLLDRLQAPAADIRPDAILLLQATPRFHSPYGVPAVLMQAHLIDRRGHAVQTVELTALAPVAPGSDSEQRLRWWGQGRWQRFVQQALQAGAVGLAGRMEPRPDAAEREARFVDTKSRQPALEIESARLRSSLCALETGGRPLVVRYERRWKEVRVATLCADEDAARLPGDADPLLSGVRPVDALPTP
jgi:hypothetical protein